MLNSSLATNCLDDMQATWDDRIAASTAGFWSMNCVCQTAVSGFVQQVNVYCCPAPDPAHPNRVAKFLTWVESARLNHA